LQSIATEDEILICKRTFQKLSGAIEAEVLPPVHIKGIDEPITVYKVNK
jgi:class 3 adenylate cyclase